MEEDFNTAEELNIFRTVEAPTAAPLYGLNISELTFPKAEHMGL